MWFQYYEKICRYILIYPNVYPKYELALSLSLSLSLNRKELCLAKSRQKKCIDKMLDLSLIHI